MTEDYQKFLVRDGKKITPWIEENKMIHVTQQDAIMEMKHETTEVNICVRAIDKKIAKNQETDMQTSTTPESLI